MPYGIRARKRLQKAFLAAYAENSNISESAKIAGINRGAHYDWLATDPEYVAAFEDANAEADDKLKRESRRRAIEGWDEPVFQRGELVGYIHKFSDRMLELELKAHFPDLYRERISTEHSGPNGGAISIKQDYSDLSVAEQDALIVERIRELENIDPEFARLTDGLRAGQTPGDDRRSD